MLLSPRKRQVMVVDLFLLCLIPSVALVLRFKSLEPLSQLAGDLMLYTLLSLIWKMMLFYPMGLYDRYWRLASVEDFSILAAVSIASWIAGIAITLVILKPVGLLSGLPQAVPVIDGALTLLVIGGLRFGFRVMDHLSRVGGGRTQKQKVLIAGAGSAGSMVVKELRVNARWGLEPVGIVDNDLKMMGIRLNGVPVLGTLQDLPRLITSEMADEVIIALPEVSGRVIREIARICDDAHVKSRTIPRLYGILEGSAAVPQFRDIQIEDLLKRGVMVIDNDRVKASLQGARVLVTGAGGSIGSELCRQLVKFEPSELILVGQGENSIFQIASELDAISEDHPSLQIHSVVANIRDRERMDFVLQLHRPRVIYHAAAYKHVGLMEANVADAVINNVMGTRILVELAAQHGVEQFVMVSSEKAAKPTSVMGVTKRVAELLVLDAAGRTGKAFVTVRFGNVLGTRGSVVSIFKKQIAAGGPVLVTHPDATRHFMTIPEAVQLVLQASTMGRGGEVFVLDVGEPTKILDLARDMIRLSGQEEGRDIEIKFTGLRKWEKVNEDQFGEGEVLRKSEHSKILVCAPGEKLPRGKELHDDVALLITAAQENALERVEEALKKLVPDYTPALTDAEALAKQPIETPVASKLVISIHRSTMIAPGHRCMPRVHRGFELA